jgi:hypothetical protein
VRQYAATLITEYATDQLALRFLESQFAQAENPEHRRMLRRKIERLAGNENVESIERIRAEFVEAMQKQAPYLPDIVYAVIRTDPASQP